jgi:hypothetical protein
MKKLFSIVLLAATLATAQTSVSRPDTLLNWAFANTNVWVGLGTSSSISTTGYPNLSALGELSTANCPGYARIELLKGVGAGSSWQLTTGTSTAAPTFVTSSAGATFEPSTGSSWASGGSGGSGPACWFLISSATGGNVLCAGTFSGSVGVLTNPSTLQIVPTYDVYDKTIGW